MYRYTLFIFVILSIPLGAQDYFFNYVKGWENNYSAELEDGYLVVGLDSDLPFQNKLTLNKINFDGSPIDTTFFTWEDALSTHSQLTASVGVRLNEDSIMLIGNYSNDLATHFEATLLKYSISENSFTVLTETNDETTNEVGTQHWCLEVPNDSTIYTATRITAIGEPEKTALINYDISGNIRWQYDYIDGCEYCVLRPRQVLSLNNGNVAMLIDIYREVIPYGGLYDRREVIIVIVDGETGEEINVIHPGDQDGYALLSGGILEMENEDILTCFVDPLYYDNTGKWQYNDESAIHLERYTIDGELVSSQNYYETLPHTIASSDHGYRYWVRQMQWLEDGNILLSGTSHFGGMIMKINPAGELIWFRDHYPHEFENYSSFQVWYTRFNHVLPTSDGGYLCTGTFFCDPGNLYPQGIQTAIAVKLDQYGCLDEGCQVGIVENTMSHEALIVYPNPSRGTFHVKLPENQELTLQVYDVVGAMVLQESARNNNEYLLDLSHLNDGVYTIQLSTQSGKHYFAKILKQ